MHSVQYGCEVFVSLARSRIRLSKKTARFTTYTSPWIIQRILDMIFRITDIMPFRKSTNSSHILPLPGNRPTSQLFFPPPLLVWQPAQLAGILCQWYSGSHPSRGSAAKTIQHSHAILATYACRLLLWLHRAVSRRCRTPSRVSRKLTQQLNQFGSKTLI